MLDGSVPSINRADEICAALGLEFYIGLPRDGLDANTIRERLREVAQELERLRARASEAADPLPERGLSADATAAIRAAIEGAGDGRATAPDALAVAAANEDDLPPCARAMAAREVEVAAGGGAVALDEALEKGRVFFRRDWLDRHGIDTTLCVVIGVRGESMEPTLPDGCSILVDRSRTRRRDGGIFVIDTEDGLIVKRLGKVGRRWQLVSDHPAWEPAPWPREAEVVGEVRWASRTFG